MPKEIAIGKRAKISEAQQYMLMAVFGAAIFLGIGCSLTLHFFKQIAFNAEVIIEQDQAIDAYSGVIKSIGICKKPGNDRKAYSKDELNKCNPDGIEVSEIPNTLRANILNELAVNKALGSVPKDGASDCLNPDTEKNYTYKELDEIYDEAKTTDELIAASNLIKKCSALRVIPDALPAFKNEEALLASLNKLFIISKLNPESLSPSGMSSVSDLGTGLNSVVVNFALENTTPVEVATLLVNIERSIREFNILSTTLSWSSGASSDTSIAFRAQATAFYNDESSIAEVNKTIKVEKGSKK